MSTQERWVATIQGISFLLFPFMIGFFAWKKNENLLISFHQMKIMEKIIVYPFIAFISLLFLVVWYSILMMTIQYAKGNQKMKWD